MYYLISFFLDKVITLRVLRVSLQKTSVPLKEFLTETSSVIS